MTLPWMGRHRGTPRHPVRLISLFVAGMLVFIGMQASVSLGPALKPQRLERSQLPDQNRFSAAFEKAQCASSADASGCLRQFGVHDFVYAFLSAPGLVTEYMRTQIGLGGGQPVLHAAQLAGTASPRGPPTTTS